MPDKEVSAQVMIQYMDVDMDGTGWQMAPLKYMLHPISENANTPMQFVQTFNHIDL